MTGFFLSGRVRFQALGDTPPCPRVMPNLFPHRLPGPRAPAFLAITLLAGCLGYVSALAPAKRALVATAVPSPSPSAFVPPATSPLANSCLPAGGQIVSSQVDSGVLGHALQFLRYLPPCYAPANDPSYPLVFFFAGPDWSPARWLQLGIPGMADRLIQGGRIPAVVLVLPEDQGEPLLEAAVLADLLPALERGHPLARERVALGGLHSGASRALKLALERPDLFASIALYNPQLDDPGLAQVYQWSAAVPGDLRPRVYLDALQEDPFISPALSLRSVLGGAGFVVEGQLRSGANSDQDWAAHLEEYLLWYSQSWR